MDLLPRLLALYHNDPDSGIHGAADWLLRKWGRAGLTVNGSPMADALHAIDRELAQLPLPLGEGRGEVLTIEARPSQLLRVSRRKPNLRRWFVNSQGQTYAVIRGPIEFDMGSPAHDTSFRYGDETLHRRRIGRSFAVVLKEVTLGEFRKFQTKHQSQGADRNAPVNNVSWFDAASYCRWLSEQEGFPEDQQCYRYAYWGFRPARTLP